MARTLGLVETFTAYRTTTGEPITVDERTFDAATMTRVAPPTTPPSGNAPDAPDADDAPDALDAAAAEDA